METATQTDDSNRRKNDRVFCAEQEVRLTIRLRGEMRSHRAELLDISSIGAAVALTRPLTAERTAFVSILWGEHHLRNVVCTISNCLQTSKTNALLTGYRCGLSFRLASPLQLDGQETVDNIDRLINDLAMAMDDLDTSDSNNPRSAGFGLEGFDIEGSIEGSDRATESDNTESSAVKSSD